MGYCIGNNHIHSMVVSDGDRVLKQEEFEQKVTTLLAKCYDVLTERGANYATDDDFLENFKHTAVILSEHGFTHHGKPLTPESFALIMSIIKNQRWSNRMKVGKDPTDDHIDGINYHLLGHGCRIDSIEKVKSEQ